MPHSIRSSKTSAPCRLEWRPSCWVIAALVALGVLSACSVLISEMPRHVAWPLALLAVGYGTWLAWRESQRRVRQLVWTIGGFPSLDGEELQTAHLEWRGPLAFLHWRDAQRAVHRLSWWPDTLPMSARRELRLVAEAGMSAPSAASMAP